MTRYRILPDMVYRFRLQRWVGLPFIGLWIEESAEDDYDDLAGRVRLCGGVLVNRPLQATSG